MTESSIYGGEVANPYHPVPDELADALQTVHKEELGALARQDDEHTKLSPTVEERREIAEVYDSVGQELGVNVPAHRKRLEEVRSRQADRMRDLIRHRVSDHVPHPEHYQRRGGAFDPAPLPLLTSREFWWASAQFFGPNEFTLTPTNFGLNCTGGFNTYIEDGQVEIGRRLTRFGVTSLFELQAFRIPSDPNRPTQHYRSSPHIELKGGMDGRAPEQDTIFGVALEPPLWCRCFAHRKQTLFQWGFGPSGSGRIILGEKEDEPQLIIFEQNSGRTVFRSMPGFQSMPSLEFSDPNPAESIWAELEVRFEIDVQGAGSIIALNPRVLISAGFQWPLELAGLDF